jgi:two-component system sensor histidine kinase/response regulator
MNPAPLIRSAQGRQWLRCNHRRQLLLIAFVTVITVLVAWTGLILVERLLVASPERGGSMTAVTSVRETLQSGFLAGLAAVTPLLVALIWAMRRVQIEWERAERDRVVSQDNERRARAIIEVDPECVLVTGPERRILDVNPAGCALIEVGFPEELVGRDFTQFLHPLDRHAFERAHESALEGRSSSGKGRLITTTGHVRWIDITSVPLPGAECTPPSVLSVVRDVTEQKRAECRQALQHAVAKVLAESSSVEQAVPDLLRAITTALEWDLGLFWRVQEGRHVLAYGHAWSGTPSAVEPFMAASRERTFSSGTGLPGRCWARGEPQWIGDVFRDEQFARREAAIVCGLRAGCAFPIWLRANVFGVMEFFCRDTQSLDPDMLGALGTIGSQIGLFIERTEVEATLREHESRTRLIIDTALDAVIMIDGEGRITEWNAQAETMFGWSQHEAIGRDLAETIVPPVYRKAHREGLARFRATGTASVLNTLTEITALRRDGSEFPVELAIAPLRIDGAVSFSAFVRDITSRKEAENSLTAYAQELERINRELDAALMKAQAATEAKSSFLATMSHEIRTPMNGIIGMTGLLLDTKLTPEQREYANTVRSCGEHLLTIINDILDFSKIEAGKLNLEIIDFDLRHAVEDALEMFAERASSKRVNLACLFHADVPTALRGDPGRLRQVLMNLIGNAIKFTDHGDVVVHVQPGTITEADAVVRFDVTDTGIGISREAQERLFQAFSQADGSTTRKYGGTGLGLAICKRLVELMGGEIGVSSEPGRGSCFWFTVRLGRQAGVAQEPNVAAGSLAGVRVLIVDDKAINRRMLELLTKKWGMHPTLVEEGPAALALLESSPGAPPYEVALLDLDMGTMDGLELARTIRARPEWSAIRLVLLTSLGRRGDAKTAWAAGLAAYLTKPIRERQLSDCLLAVLGRAQEPMRAADAAPVASQGLITRHTLAERRTRTAPRVLVAEDNIINQKVAVRLIERLGYRVDVVANGQEAVEALSRIPYGLVFMDCQMPEMDGFEAAREIRRREAGGTRQSGSESGAASPLPLAPRRVPIVAMTANAMQGDRERCLESGMDDYISKPITSQALAAVLERYLERDRGDRAA